MFQRILVPVDGTARSERAVPYALGLAQSLGAEAIVCRILTTPLVPHSAAEEQDAAEYVGRIGERFRAASVAAKAIVRRGDASREIRHAAIEWGADAIVMATRARRPLDKLVLGSVADVIVRESQLPVLLVSAQRAKRLKRSA